MIALEKITQAAKATGLDFLVIGGYAVMVHGFTRVTLDLDLLVRARDQETWKGLLVQLGWSVLAGGNTFLQFSFPSDALEHVDLMLVNDESFSRMSAAASVTELLGTPTHVVSLLHLIALKCHAVKHGHAGRVEKDVDDLIQLVKANNLDVQGGELPAIILKYGIPELYEKLKRAAEKGR